MRRRARRFATASCPGASESAERPPPDDAPPPRGAESASCGPRSGSGGKSRSVPARIRDVAVSIAVMSTEAVALYPEPNVLPPKLSVFETDFEKDAGPVGAGAVLTGAGAHTSPQTSLTSATQSSSQVPPDSPQQKPSTSGLQIWATQGLQVAVRAAPCAQISGAQRPLSLGCATTGLGRPSRVARAGAGGVARRA